MDFCATGRCGGALRKREFMEAKRDFISSTAFDFGAISHSMVPVVADCPKFMGSNGIMTDGSMPTALLKSAAEISGRFGMPT